jgi:uncharacterized membrane protein YjgN (DUF898 family)
MIQTFKSNKEKFYHIWVFVKYVVFIPSRAIGVYALLLSVTQLDASLYQELCGGQGS